MPLHPAPPMKNPLALAGLATFLLSGLALGQVCPVVQDIHIGPGDASPQFPHSVGGKYLLFRADDGSSGNELYRWDANGGVVQLAEIRPGASGSFAYGFTTILTGGKLLTVFAANNGSIGSELWVTDGVNTSLLLDLNPGPSGSSPFNFFYHPVQNAIFFAANDGVSGSELWRTDGTLGGTFQVADINPGSGGSGPSEIAAYGPFLVLGADDGTNGRELWLSAGFPGGTFLVADLNPGVAGSNPRTFHEVGGKLLFAATEASVGTELFVSDGTTPGTSLLVDLNPGPLFSNATGLTTFHGEVFFSADDGVHGAELWKSDGTLPGTALVADIRPGSFGSAAVNLTVANDKLFFSATNVGRELYVTDGTTAGTVEVADINPGGASSSPDYLTPASTGVYFEARGPVGSELYFSDGTAAGTTLICDIYPTALSGNPANLILCDGDLFFSADDATVGVELRRLALPGAYVQDLGQSGDGSRLSATFPVLGSTATVSVENAPVGGIGLLLMSAPNGGPTSFLTQASSTSWIDPLTYSILNIYLTTSLTLNQPIPTAPALIGGQVHLQAWSIPPVGFPASTSNGLQLVLGN